MEITITCYGHSCFKVEAGEKSVILDPYEKGSVPGVELPEGLECDRVYCSHSHGDHNARHLIAEKDPLSLVFDADFITVPHDDAQGTKRGFSDITFLHIGKCTIAHLGDIGREPEKDEYKELKKADVLMIPVGGYYTIDSVMAKKIIENTNPSLTILMHFRKGSRGYDVLEDIHDIGMVFPLLEEKAEDFITFEDDSVPHGIMTLEPLSSIVEEAEKEEI